MGHGLKICDKKCNKKKMTKLKTEQKIWNQSCTLALNEWIYVRLHKQTGRKHLGAVKEKIHPLIWSSWTRSSTFYNHFLSFTSPKPVSLLDLNGHFPPSKLEPSHHHIHIHSDDQVKHFFFSATTLQLEPHAPCVPQ